MKVLGYAANGSVFTKQDAQTLTHIYAAFGRLDCGGKLHVKHLPILKQMQKLRSWNPDIKICVSVKGQQPQAFGECAADEKLRAKVGKSCAEVLEKYGFDGVDFDWEFPCCPSNGVAANPRDTQNFTLLLQAVRSAVGTQKLLSIAAGADNYYVDAIECDKVAQIVDYVCVMTYDLKCGFHALSGHHTALYDNQGDVFRNSCDRAMRLFVSRGFAPQKLLMGAAFYSRQWKHVPRANNGFLQLCRSGGGYGPSFTKLHEEYINKRGYIRYWDDEAKAPYLFNGHRFISYDDPQSVRLKCDYVQQNGYAGIFYWEHSCDATGLLLGEMHDYSDAVKAAAEKAEQERLAAEKAAAEKAEQERLAAEKAAAEKAEQERLAAEKAAAEKAEQKRLAAEKSAAEKAEQERLAAEKSAAEKAEQERLAAEKAAAEKAEKERLAAEKAAAEKAEQERLAAEKAAAEKAEQERLAAEKAAAEKAEQKVETGENKPAKAVPTDKQQAETKPASAEPKAAEPKAAEPKAAEPKAAEPKAAGQPAAEKETQSAAEEQKKDAAQADKPAEKKAGGSAAEKSAQNPAANTARKPAAKRNRSRGKGKKRSH